MFFFDGFSDGIFGAIMGDYSGGAIGGITGGIKANKMGLNFWDGEGVIETPFDNSLVGIGKNLEYSNESLDDFINKNEELFKLSANVDEVHADGTGPKNYKFKNGYLVNSKGSRVNGATSISRVRGSSRMIIRTYLSKGVFKSSAQLYMTVHHEFMHANFWSFQLGFSSADQHAIINNWHYDQLKAWKLTRRASLFTNPYSTFSKYFKSKNPNHYTFFGFKTITTLPRY